MPKSVYIRHALDAPRIHVDMLDPDEEPTFDGLLHAMTCFVNKYYIPNTCVILTCSKGNQSLELKHALEDRIGKHKIAVVLVSRNMADEEYHPSDSFLVSQRYSEDASNHDRWYRVIQSLRHRYQRILLCSDLFDDDSKHAFFLYLQRQTVRPYCSMVLAKYPYHSLTHLQHPAYVYCIRPLLCSTTNLGASAFIEIITNNNSHVKDSITTSYICPKTLRQEMAAWQFLVRGVVDPYEYDVMKTDYL